MTSRDQRLRVSAGDDPDGAMFAALRRIAEEVHAGDAEESVMEKLVRAVIAYGPWPAVWVRTFDASHRSDRRVYQAGYSEAAVAAWGDWPWKGSPSQRAVDTGQIVAVTDSATFGGYPYMVDHAGEDGFLSGLYVPLPDAGIRAVMGVSRPEVHEFGPAETALAQVIATLASLAIRNVVMRDEAVRTERTTNADLTRLNRTITEQNADLNRMAAVHRRLLSVQFDHGGLGRLCDELAQMLEAPVVLLDRFHQVSASSSGAAAEAADVAAAYAASVRRRSGDRQTGAEILAQTVGGRRLLIGPVIDEERVVGTLVAWFPAEPSADDERSRPAEGIAARILEQGCLHVALDVLRQRAALEGEMRAQGDFVQALASDNPAELARRATVMGVVLEQPLQVLRVRAEGARGEPTRPESSALADLLRRRLRDAGSDAVVAPLTGREFVVVVAVAPAAAEVSIEQATSTARATLLLGLAALLEVRPSELLVSIGIGSPGTGVDALRASYDEALRALDVMSATDRTGTDLAIGDTGSYSLLTVIAEPDRRQFVQRYLGPLLTYERRHGGGLLDTLQSYFECVGNVQRIAESLFLHVSTVRYRLGRIEQIVGISLRDRDDLLCLQLALRLAGLGGPRVG